MPCITLITTKHSLHFIHMIEVWKHSWVGSEPKLIWDHINVAKGNFPNITHVQVHTTYISFIIKKYLKKVAGTLLSVFDRTYMIMSNQTKLPSFITHVLSSPATPSQPSCSLEPRGRAGASLDPRMHQRLAYSLRSLSDDHSGVLQILWYCPRTSLFEFCTKLGALIRIFCKKDILYSLLISNK